MSQWRKDYILVIIRIWIRIQEFFEGILPLRYMVYGLLGRLLVVGSPTVREQAVREAGTIWPRPGLQVDNIFVFIRQVAPVPAYWLFKKPATSWPWPFDLESGVRITCDSVLILVFLGLSVLDLGPMYATDVRRQTAS